MCKADSGDIELIELSIQSESIPKRLGNRKILYTPINSEFIVLFKELKNIKKNEFLNMAVKNKKVNIHKDLNVIDFSINNMKKKTFKDELKKFGDYLKKWGKD